MIRTRYRIAIVAAVMAGVAPNALSAGTSQATTRTVYLSATDAKGAPVTDLTASDITVKDDGKARDVTAVERAAGPLSIALLIDDNGYGANDVRTAVAAFAQRLRGLAEMSIVTTAGQNVTRVDYTADLEAQIGAVRQLYARPAPGGGHLLEAIQDASKSLAARPSPRRAIVALVFESPEFSTLRQDRVLDGLQQSGASLSVIAVGKPVSNTSAAAPGLDENMNRNKVIGDGPKQSGGRHAEMIAPAGVPKAMQLIADDLLHQYAVSYSLPAGVKPSGKISVAVGRRGVTLRAPTRVPDR